MGLCRGLWGGVRGYPRGWGDCHVDRAVWLHLLGFWGVLWQPLVQVVPAKACTPPLPSSFPPALSHSPGVWIRAVGKIASVFQESETRFQDLGGGKAGCGLG